MQIIVNTRSADAVLENSRYSTLRSALLNYSQRSLLIWNKHFKPITVSTRLISACLNTQTFVCYNVYVYASHRVT